MALGKRRKEEDESQIDMTPMLDVVFIMLIFFIITASFVNEVGLDVNRPPTSEGPLQTQKIQILCFAFQETMKLCSKVAVSTSARCVLTLKGYMLKS